MVAQWNSDGLLGGPERRHNDRRRARRETAERRRRPRRRQIHTAMLGAAVSSAPMIKAASAIVPPARAVNPQVDVTTEFVAVPASEAYDDIIREAAAIYELDPHLIHAVMQAESAFHPY